MSTTAAIIAFTAGILIGYAAMTIRAGIRDAQRLKATALAEARWIAQRNPALARRYLQAIARYL